MLLQGSPGGIFTAKTWDTYASHDPYGANAALVSAASNPATTLDTVNTVMKKNGYRCAGGTRVRSWWERLCTGLDRRCWGVGT